MLKALINHLRTEKHPIPFNEATGKWNIVICSARKGVVKLTVNGKALYLCEDDTLNLPTFEGGNTDAGS